LVNSVHLLENELKTSEKYAVRDDIHSQRWTRRQFVQFGGAGTLSLGGLWHARLLAEQQGIPTQSAIRACIFIFYYGGPSHLDTYDLKPNAPSNVRGEFQPISTSVPGLQICEHLPHMSKVMHRCALIRSMHHTNRLHDSAAIETHTGRQASQGDREEFAPIPQFFPCHGAVVNYLRREQQQVVAHAALPFVFRNVIDVPCQGGGFLGSAFDAFRISVDGDQQNYAAQELTLHDDLSTNRMRGRTQLLREINQSRANTFKSPESLTKYYDRALNLLDSDIIRRALDVSLEPEATRERYGIYSSSPPGSGTGAANGFARHMRGQNLLVARRLVEAGVPFVNVYDFRQQGQNWDAHAQNFAQHKDILLPAADRGLAALISDLDERGLLDSTLIVATGEFGRTPQINKDGGRDHWPDCYSVLLAGGGVHGGAIHGASDSIGAYPAIDPATPADLAATIYWRFGFDPSQLIYDRTSRPWHLASGKPIRGLFGSTAG
jgi:hypothetical protein